MSLYQRLKNVFKPMAASLKDKTGWLVDWVRGGQEAASGEAVNEVIALGLTAYFACIRNISEDIAKLPLGVYKQLEPRGSELQKDHPVHRCLHYEANDEMSAMTFRQTLTAHALGWHGGFAEIVRDGISGLRLYPLDPTCVQRRRDEYGGDQRLYYLVHGHRFEARDIFDIHGLGYDGLTGYVMAHLAKDPLGNAIAAQKFAGAFYGNGTVTTGIIKVPDAMSETAFKHLRESFHERHGGGGNAHKPIILEEGAEWQSQTSNAKDSQMLEVLQHGIEEVCRLYRMPPHKVQHLLRATFSNIESQALEYVVDCLLGWGVRWEQEIYRKLLLPRERKTLFAKHNFNMLLRGDSAARSTFYRELFNIGVLSPNDIRDKEDMNPIEGGDAYFVNAAIIPLDMAATGEHLKATEPEPAPEPAEDGDEDDTVIEPADDAPPQSSASDHRYEIVARVAAAHRKSIEDAIAGVLRVEHDKVCRASKKPDFQTWAADFYQESHPKHVAERISPCIEALSASLDAVIEGRPMA
jgi:HK97 family phage portal protein